MTEQTRDPHVSGGTGTFHHIPVLLNPCMEALDPKDGRTYLDGTLGGGGHASALLARAPRAVLYGVDRDADALRAATARLTREHPDAHFNPIYGNFHDAAAILRERGVFEIDGALLDLGVSSYQLDEAERGFSYHADAPLDMRMDRNQSLTAETIVNEWSQAEIARILREYGEENWAAQIARVLCDRRVRERIDTTAKLTNLIDASIPKKMREKDGSHPARRTFQALRIAVNDELAPLTNALRDLVSLLAPGGRLAVLTFHSLEDRIVKNTFRELADPCTCPKDFPVCVCGKKPTVRLLTRKPISASESELSENPRARSAHLRTVEKLPKASSEERGRTNADAGEDVVSLDD